MPILLQAYVIDGYEYGARNWRTLWLTRKKNFVSLACHAENSLKALDLVRKENPTLFITRIGNYTHST